MVDLLWTSLALVLVLEGLLPLVAPRVWRDAFRRLTELSDGQLRFVGLAALATGLAALFWAVMLATFPDVGGAAYGALLVTTVAAGLAALASTAIATHLLSGPSIVATSEGSSGGGRLSTQ